MLASTLAAAPACKSKSSEGEADTAGKEAAGDSKGSADTGTPSDPAIPGTETDDPRALALAVTQAKTPLAIKAKAGKALPSSLKKIQHLYALAASAKQPEWGATGEGEPKLSRDDDLDTAWTCKTGQATNCVLGFALPEPAKIEIVRIYGAAGPRFRDYTGHPRLGKVRVHTDAGFVEVTLPDGANHAYVLFDQPVETQTLAIELLDVHKGKTDPSAHFADVEIFGTEGVPRTPIMLDPSQAWVSWETTAWDDGPQGKYTIRQTFIEFMRSEGPVAANDPAKPPLSRRFLRATGVYGKAGDDYLLFERMFASTCDESEGSYLLFDRRNRMFYPLVDLGGIGAPVYRHREGRGFAAGWIDGERFTVKGIVEEAGELHWKRPPKQLPEDPLALLSEWGFETTPISRGGRLAEPPAGCGKADAAAIDRLLTAAKLPLGGEIDPASWLTCKVGTDTLFVSAMCDAPAQAYSISATDTLVGKFVSKTADSRGFRLRRTEVGESLLLELTTEQGASSLLYWVDAGSFAQLEKAGGLLVRPPTGCPACTDEWGAIDESAETGETGAEEGMLDGSDEEMDGEEDEAEEEEGEFTFDNDEGEGDDDEIELPEEPEVPEDEGGDEPPPRRVDPGPPPAPPAP
ncbi:hypothetical protein ACNOYE_04800 [Nannocystaceae bacterium ST9]